MIYVLYGQPASGKTTLGKMLAEHWETPFVIDGDEFRKIIPNNNYGRDGREENIKNHREVCLMGPSLLSGSTSAKSLQSVQKISRKASEIIKKSTENQPPT